MRNVLCAGQAAAPCPAHLASPCPHTPATLAPLPHAVHPEFSKANKDTAHHGAGAHYWDQTATYLEYKPGVRYDSQRASECVGTVRWMCLAARLQQACLSARLVWLCCATLMLSESACRHAAARLPAGDCRHLSKGALLRLPAPLQDI